MDTGAPLSRCRDGGSAGVDPIDLPALPGELLQQVPRAAAHVEHATGGDAFEQVRWPPVAACCAPAPKPRQQPLQRIVRRLTGVSPEVEVLAWVIPSQSLL